MGNQGGKKPARKDRAAVKCAPHNSASWKDSARAQQTNLILGVVSAFIAQFGAARSADASWISGTARAGIVGIVACTSGFQCGGNLPPAANAGPDRSSPAGVTVVLDGSASSDPDGGVIAYWWDFGDGAYTGWQSASAVSHVYNSNGSYNAALYVQDNCGAVSAADTAVVTIGGNGCQNNQPPNANPGGNRTGWVGLPVPFTGSASSDVDGAIQSYSWNFGDNTTSSGLNVSHTYSNGGSYLVTLTVTDNCGASGQSSCTIQVMVDNSDSLTGDSGDTTGDGSPPNPCAGNQPPVANAGPDKSGVVGQQVNFSGAGSSDPNGPIATYVWNFGDNTTGNGVNVSHAYAAAGAYTVTLTVTDPCGATHSDTAQAVILPPDPCQGNAPPNSNAGPDVSATAGQTVGFTGAGSSDANGTITSYSWNFGDGGTASGVNVSHVFAAAGVYTVTLNVTDNCNATHSDTAAVTVTPQGGSLQAVFSVCKLTSTNPNVWVEVGTAANPVEHALSVKLDGSASVSASLYRWRENGILISTLPVLMRTYLGPQQLQLSLTVIDTAGNTNVLTKTLHVAAGMTALSTMPAMGQTYRPLCQARIGNKIWCVGESGKIAVGNLSIPSVLPAMQVFEQPQLFDVLSMTATPSPGNGRFILARGNAGVDIYAANEAGPSTPVNIPVTALGGGAAFRVACVGNTLYVGTTPAAGVRVFDISGSTPVAVTNLTIPAGLMDMDLASDQFMVVRGNGAQLTVLNLSNPGNPTIVGTPIQLAGGAIYAVDAAAGWVGARTPNGIVLIRADQLGQAPNPPTRLLVHYSSNFTMRGDALYSFNIAGQTVTKFNIVDPDNMYQMEQVSTAAWQMSTWCLHDPDGATGPIPEALIVGFNATGYKSFSP